MKNILLITTMYPTPDSDFHTKVCHYFTKEWVQMGYNVKVIHFKSTFPFFFYWIASLFNKQIAKFIGNDDVEIKRRNKDLNFNIDYVSVHSIPIFKLIPHGKYSTKTIKNQITTSKRGTYLVKK